VRETRQERDAARERHGKRQSKRETSLEQFIKEAASSKTVYLKENAIVTVLQSIPGSAN
jgi:hypothetical protein